MKIIFHKKFYNSDYADDGASVPGRMESIMDKLTANGKYVFIEPQPASIMDIQRCHSAEMIEKEKNNEKRYEMALLSAGGAIMASESCIDGDPSFACIRPPGHHASRDTNWGYCVFCNMAIALLRLREQGLIKSAFILDFDAHTGDGTKNILSDWKECNILNPMAEDNNAYMKVIEQYIKEVDHVDIVGVCAGFDSYVKDIGRKLETFDFYQMGFLMKILSKRMGHNRRFAILEGGYYLPDLGKNALAFCNGFE